MCAFFLKPCPAPFPVREKKGRLPPFKGQTASCETEAKRGFSLGSVYERGHASRFFRAASRGTMYSKFPLISDFVSRPPAISRSSS